MRFLFRQGKPCKAQNENAPKSNKTALCTYVNSEQAQNENRKQREIEAAENGKKNFKMRISQNGSEKWEKMEKGMGNMTKFDRVKLVKRQISKARMDKTHLRVVF